MEPILTPILQIEGLRKSYGLGAAKTEALRGLDLTVGAGEFTGVMGASGSGKTTLLNCVSTIDRPTEGRIRVEGRDITALKGRELSRFRREKLGFIFQDCNLLDTLTVFENIALALTILGEDAKAIRPRVTETARLLGIEKILNKFPYQVSGGERQRAAAARAIITRPALILADEPTGALDSRSAGLLLDRLDHLNREQGATILMVTHDAFTASWCRRIFFLKDGARYAILDRGGDNRQAFFRRIMAVVEELGEGESHVC